MSSATARQKKPAIPPIPEKSELKTAPKPSETKVWVVNGKAVRWEWKVDTMGARGPGHKRVNVPEDMHRGHVRAVAEGATINTVDDSALNIVPQTPDVNLSNVKRFENWRVKECQGEQVYCELLPNGHMHWVMPDTTPPVDVTMDPNAEGKWDDQWWLKGGTWPQ